MFPIFFELVPREVLVGLEELFLELALVSHRKLFGVGLEIGVNVFKKVPSKVPSRVPSRGFPGYVQRA